MVRGAAIGRLSSQSKGGLGSLAGLAGSLPIDLPIDVGGGSDAERIYAVLRSRTVTDAVIQKFGLIERYDNKYIEATRKELWQHCVEKLDKKPGVVSITCEDKDPAVAQAMAEYVGEFGNIVFRRISASTAGEERRFLEQRVAEAKNDVETASQRVRAFEEKNHLIDLTEQSKALVSAMASLKGELLSKQLELSYLTSFSAGDESTAAQLRRQVAVMDAKMKSLEGAYENDVGPVTRPTADAAKARRAEQSSSLFPQASTVPKLRFEMTELYRQQKIAETVFLVLTQRFEMAKVNEARDTSTFQILDHAALPTHKSRPPRLQIILAGFILGLIAGIAWSRYRSSLEKLFSSPTNA